MAPMTVSLSYFCIERVINVVFLAFGYCHSRGVRDSTDDDAEITEFKANIGEFFAKVTPSFLLAIVIAVAVSFFFIITLKWSAAFVFWGFVTVVMLLLAILIIAVGIAIGTTANKAENKKVAEEAKVCFCKVYLNYLK